MKGLIESHFAKHYNLHRNSVDIKEQTTKDVHFDLQDGIDPFIVDYKTGFASFENNRTDEIKVLDYENYICSFVGTVFEKGRKRCDFIINDKANDILIFNEITSSYSGIENLKIPIFSKKDKTVVEYPGGKFEKVEQQLAESLKTLHDVVEIGDYMDKQVVKICLCSYKLHIGDEQNMIGNPLDAFNMNLSIMDKLLGENGAIISCPNIEKYGFEYRRISHDFAFRIN